MSNAYVVCFDKHKVEATIDKTQCALCQADKILAQLRQANIDIRTEMSSSLAKLAEKQREAISEFQKALDVWSRLSTLVGCTSPDGSAELDQVAFIMEELASAKSNAEALGEQLNDYIARVRMFEAFLRLQNLEVIRQEIKEKIRYLKLDTEDEWAFIDYVLKALVRQLERDST